MVLHKTVVIPLKSVICCTGRLQKAERQQEEQCLKILFNFLLNNYKDDDDKMEANGGAVEAGEEVAVSGCQWQQLTSKQTDGLTDRRTDRLNRKSYEEGYGSVEKRPIVYAIVFVRFVCGSGNSAYE